MGVGRYLIAAVPLRLAGSGLTVALPLLAIETADDVRLGGLLVAVTLAPTVFAAPIAGVALDRSRHPRALVAGAGAIAALGIAVSVALGPVPLPLVVAALLIVGVVTPFFFGGLSSFATDAIPDERRAYAADALSYNVGAVVGPAIAAVLATATSARVAIAAFAAVTLVGAVAALAVRMTRHESEPIPVGRAIAIGARQLVAHRPLAVSVLSGTLTQLGQGALPIAAVTVAIERAGRADEGGFIVTAFAIGALVGVALTLVRRVREAPPEWTMGLGFAATGVLTIAASADLGMPWTVVVAGLAGIPTAAATAGMLLIRKQQSSPAARAQVFTVAAGLRTTAAAAGAAIAALLAHLDGGILIALVGLAWLVSAGVMLAYPRGAEPIG